MIDETKTLHDEISNDLMMVMTNDNMEEDYFEDEDDDDENVHEELIEPVQYRDLAFEEEEEDEEEEEVESIHVSESLTEGLQPNNESPADAENKPQESEKQEATLSLPSKAQGECFGFRNVKLSTHALLVIMLFRIAKS